MKTTQQVARELGVKHWHIRHVLDGDYIPKPPIFSGRFVFGEDDVANLKAYFDNKKEPHEQIKTLDDIFDQ